MSLRDRIFLVWNYGKIQLLVGALYNLMCTGFLAGSFSYAGFVDAFILKAIVAAVTLYLVLQFRDRDAIFFYINLGLSRRKLQISVLLADFLSLAFLLTLDMLFYGKA